MIADPLWSCVMLLCGSFVVLCGSFAVFSHTHYTRYDSDTQRYRLQSTVNREHQTPERKTRSVIEIPI